MRKKQPEEPAGRITTDTLAEHRERVLAGGRKFKYPVQYQRHRLVINAVIIGVAALILAIVLTWYLLYVAKNTSDFMYRVTKVVPVPVAMVDGQSVSYSDYLMKYRSAEHYLLEKEQIDAGSESGKSQLAYVRTEALNDAIADAYATKLARELDVTVTDDELETYLKQQRQSSDGEVTEATYNAVIEDYYGWSPAEYREAMKAKLLRQKVAYAVDSPAEDLSKSVEEKVRAGTADLKAIADGLIAADATSASYTQPTWIPRGNQDGGISTAAEKLEKGQVSTVIKPTTGDYYIYIKLLDSNESQLQYEALLIPLREFDKRLDQLETDKKLTTYIKFEEDTTNS